MMEEELVQIWQSSPNQEQIKFDKSRLMLEVQSGIDRVEKSIRYRDFRETIAVVLVAPFFMYWAYKTPFILTKIASVLIVIYGIFVLIRLKAARKHKPGPFTESYIDYLHKTREHLNAQKHLLDTVLYWYILPGYIGITLFTIGSGIIPYIIKMQVLTISFSVVIYFLNKRAVQKTLVPRITKIEALINSMEKP